MFRRLFIFEGLVVLLKNSRKGGEDIFLEYFGIYF